ncbi:MAG: hypothetical protein VX756_08850 [Bacteroidota bacterium]|nr:hypothetical protein [Bacteroidota bacterium]
MSNERPTFKEWVAENPRKSINDYYKIYGTEFSDSTAKVKTKPTQQSYSNDFNSYSVDSKMAFNSLQIICMIFSGIMTASYFLPWLEYNVMGQNLVSVTGFEVPKMIQDIEQFKNMFRTDKTYNSPNIFYVLHLFPICGVGILISVISKTNVFRFLGELTIIIIMCWFIHKLVALQTNSVIKMSILDFAGLGLFFSVICSIYFLFDLLKLITK